MSCIMIENLDDTLDEVEPIEIWVQRRTRASEKGFLNAETVLELYEEETGGHSDVYTVTRVLATLYMTAYKNEQLYFKANIPH